MLDRLSTEITLEIHSYLLPHCQLNLSLINKSLWRQLSPIIRRYKSLRKECSAILDGDFNIFMLFQALKARPQILPFVENLQCCPKRRSFPEITDCIKNALSRDENLGFGLLLRDLLDTQDVFTHLGNSEPLEVLAYILPYLPALRRLEFMAPFTVSGYLPLTMSIMSFQHLTFLGIRGEGRYPRVHLSWYCLALSIPTLRTFHGHLFGMETADARALEWPNELKLIGSSHVKNIFMTQSALKAWDFAASRIESLETFLYNYIEFQEEINGHNPAGIIARLPRSIKNLAIVESDMTHLGTRLGENVWGGRRIDNIQPVLFTPFWQLEILWCSWRALVPTDHDYFDLSKVLPCSLDWLVLYCVPIDEVDVLISAICRMSSLKRLWVQMHSFSRGRHVINKDAEITCMQHLRLKMQESHITWCEPYGPSPFQPYIRYLDVHS